MIGHALIHAPSQPETRQAKFRFLGSPTPQRDVTRQAGSFCINQVFSSVIIEPTGWYR
jgi:hypothetical protein